LTIRISIVLYVFLLLWLAIAIASMHISPLPFWPIGFMAFTTPAPLVLNLLFLVYWLLMRSWAAILPLLVLGIAWDYYQRGLAFNPVEQTVPAHANSVRVLNYNVHSFNNRLDEETGYQSSEEMIDWLTQHPADVLMLQEYFHLLTPPPGAEVLAVIPQFKKNNWDSYLSIIGEDNGWQEVGMVIFSRHPILNRGRILFGPDNWNHAMFADIKINEDTLRVYNVHLQSMEIDDKGVAAAVREGRHVRSQGKNTLKRLRDGFLFRSWQVDTLLSHISTSPYPVLVGGDMNDIPWSYTYEQFSKELTNSFQVRGSGWGTTYNGQIPFLRIDHQFFCDRLRIHDFTVHKEMPHSDHFPVSGVYSFR
jgi:endonuclease/exonuclease/phosphatase (EEP) superfamily protein YafD